MMRFRRIEMMKRTLITLCSLCCLSIGTLLGSSITVGTDNGSNNFPFSGPFYGYPGTDYQEAYASSDFTGPINITGIDFFLANGNLLLDISVTGGSGGSGAAFEDSEGTGTSLARYQNFGSGNGLGYGLVTEFDSTASMANTPEPGTLPLMACLGLVGLLVQRLRRRRA
jgi:hypothetical protein